MGILAIFQYGQFGNISKWMPFGYFVIFQIKGIKYFWQYFKTEALWAFFGGKIEALNAVW